MSLDVTENFKYLASQYKDTNVQDLVTNINKIIQQYLVDPICQYSELYSIDTATGIWLDYVGYRLGVFQRPSYEQVTTLTFGFNGTQGDNGATFGQAPFINALKGNIPFDDDQFRAFLKCISQQQISNSTRESFKDTLEPFFGDNIVIQDSPSGEVMTIDLIIITDRTDEEQNAVFDAGIFNAQPTGVLLNIVYNGIEAFGFNGTQFIGSKTFGQAPFVS